MQRSMHAATWLVRKWLVQPAMVGATEVGVAGGVLHDAVVSAAFMIGWCVERCAA